MTKKVCSVRNWRDYNQKLVQRGSITFWFDEENIRNWHNESRNKKRGRPVKYSNQAILCGLTLKAIFKLTYRAVEGFLQSIIKLLNLEIKCPHYSLLRKRQKTVEISLPNHNRSHPLHLVFDSTGLKIYGEGESNTDLE